MNLRHLRNLREKAFKKEEQKNCVRERMWGNQTYEEKIDRQQNRLAI